MQPGPGCAKALSISGLIWEDSCGAASLPRFLAPILYLRFGSSEDFWIVRFY